MFGSLIIFASGCVANSPNSANASGTRCASVRLFWEIGENASGERDILQLELYA